jgi:hypothetical protein
MFIFVILIETAVYFNGLECFGGCLFFFSVLLAETPYTQQQPAGLALAAVLLLAGLGGCKLVERLPQADPNLFSTVTEQAETKLSPTISLNATMQNAFLRSKYIALDGVLFCQLLHKKLNSKSLHLKKNKS